MGFWKVGWVGFFPTMYINFACTLKAFWQPRKEIGRVFLVVHNLHHSFHVFTYLILWYNVCSSKIIKFLHGVGDKCFQRYCSSIDLFWSDNRAQCGNFMIFLSLRFYVKSILENSPHSVEILWFFYHSDFTWNQFWWF